MILTPSAHVYWKLKGSKATKPIVLLSPYLTGSTAQELLRASAKGRVYTLFDAELFASRASSLSVLKQLMEAGHQLFHLDGLHAKVVIEPNAFATLGSQNVTSRGARNLELSALYTDMSTVSKVHRKIEPWLKKANPITIEMIADMEALISPLETYYDDFKAACESAQAKIDKAAELARMRAEKEKIERFQAELRAEIRRALEAAPVSQEWDRGTVKYRESSSETSLFSEGQNLLSWTVNGTPMSLVRLSRYLCATHTGEIGWARVARTRISMIGRGVDFSGQVIAECPTWRIEVESRENYLDDLPKGANIVITVKKYGRQLCVVPMRFALSSYRIFSPRPVLQSGAAESTEGKQARAWIREHKASFDKQVIYRITRTFKYGSNLLGDDAKFFGDLGSSHIIRVALIDGNPILVVKPGYWP